MIRNDSLVFGASSGAPEQQRMRIAISGSGLPPDNPLVLEARDAVLSAGFADIFDLGLLTRAPFCSRLKHVAFSTPK